MLSTILEVAANLLVAAGEE